MFHDLYFGNLGGDGEPLRKLLETAFGSFETWEKEFKQDWAAVPAGA